MRSSGNASGEVTAVFRLLGTPEINVLVSGRGSCLCCLLLNALYASQQREHELIFRGF